MHAGLAARPGSVRRSSSPEHESIYIISEHADGECRGATTAPSTALASRACAYLQGPSAFAAGMLRDDKEMRSAEEGEGEEERRRTVSTDEDETIGHNCIRHNYIGHIYGGHNCISHNHIGEHG